MTKKNQLLLGIDGGGTKTSVWLGRIETDGSPQLSVIAKETGGPSNPRSLGFDVALKNIGETVSAAFAQAGLVQTAVDYACLTLAGAGRESERAQVSSWIESSMIAREYQIVGDAEVLLAATSDTMDKPSALTGIALIAGTGSMAWGRNAQGETARSGGWGYLFGDEGSAYAIAVSALREATQAADSRTNPTPMLDAILGHLQLDSPSQLIEWCYGDSHHRQRIALLAPLVFAQYERDETARDIISVAATDLARLVESVATPLGFTTNGFTLVCTGGVLLGQPVYRELLANELRDRELIPGAVRLVEDAVECALRVAFWNSR